MEKEMEDQIKATDFLVETGNPERLDDTLQALPMMHAFVVGRGVPGDIAYREGYPVVRVFGDTGFFKFAVENQGYCKIIKQLEQLV
jgi:hypothetical protein